MTSSRERQQRAAARARLGREMAERQEQARQRRRRQAVFGAAAAVVLVLAGVIWGVTALTGDDEPETPPAAGSSPTGGTPSAGPTGEDVPASSGDCEWLPEDTSANPDLQDVGTPEVGEPPEGPAGMTITTNHGPIEVEIDAENAPCTYASFAHLADQQFYDDTSCHRLTTEGIYVLQCGDPSGTGRGGPTYKYAEENLPDGEQPTYPEGTVAMAKTQQPSTTGSQFFLVYQDTELPPDYTVVGTITEGLGILQSVASDGAVDTSGEPAGDGAPATEVTIETLRVSDAA